MKQPICWTLRGEDGVKREVRVWVKSTRIEWRFKRADEEEWDLESPPDEDDWDELEHILERRTARGKAGNLLATVRALRKLAEDEA